MQYTIEIPEEQVACINAALTVHNRALPQEVWDEDTQAMVPNPALLADEAAYVQYVMGNAAASYCQQYPLLSQFPEGTPAPAAAP